MRMFSRWVVCGVVTAVLGSLAACSTGPAKEKADADRALATVRVRECEDFNSKSGREKLDIIFGKHIASAKDDMGASMNRPQSIRQSLPLSYILPRQNLFSKLHLDRFSNFLGQVAPDAELLAATTSFLLPKVGDQYGWPKLTHTLVDRCDFLENPQAKLVHGLASMAKGHVSLYPKLKKLRPRPLPAGCPEHNRANDDHCEHRWDVTGEEVDNPWSGLFDPKANPNGVPLLIRFSLANPVANTVIVPSGPFAGKSLLLEFIPGLGIKFIVDKRKNFDVVAMESLAGQGANHNYFMKEFSPDFSRHAPPAYLAEGPEKQYMLDRYKTNEINQWVMTEVGVRFEQALVATYSTTHPGYASRIRDNKLSEAQKYGRYGPHPFMIGIQAMASTDTAGTQIDSSHQKRPFRIVFEPAVDEIATRSRGNKAEAERLAKIKDKTAHVPGNKETDFRTRLAFLKPGDTVYYLTAETENEVRYRIGTLVLDSIPIPSKFADREYFVHHEIETGRLHDRELKEQGQTSRSVLYIVDPE